MRVVRRMSDNALKIHITDQGPRIPEEDRTRIIKPFFTTKEDFVTGGLDLGLSATRGLLVDIGGSLTFESAPGHGTTFTIVFPINMLVMEKVNG